MVNDELMMINTHWLSDIKLSWIPLFLLFYWVYAAIGCSITLIDIKERQYIMTVLQDSFIPTFGNLIDLWISGFSLCKTFQEILSWCQVPGQDMYKRLESSALSLTGGIKAGDVSSLMLSCVFYCRLVIFSEWLCAQLTCFTQHGCIQTFHRGRQSGGM